MRGNVLGAFGNGRSLGGGGLGGGGPRLEDLVKAVNDTAAHTMGCEEDGGWVASKISGGARAPMDDFPAGMLSKAALSKSAKLPKLSDGLGCWAACGCWAGRGLGWAG